MKIEPQKPKPEFNPLVLTLETPEEVAALFALFNHSTIAKAVGEPDANESKWYFRIRVANDAAGNPPIEYDQLHENLERIVR